MIKNQVKRGSKLISNVRTLSELEEEVVITNPIEISTFLKKSIDYVKNTYSDRQLNISGNFLKEKISINANELLQDVLKIF